MILEGVVELSQEETVREAEAITNITSDPFYPPVIDNYQSERESPIYLTREDINKLGFYRSNPDREIYQHKDKPTLFLEQYTYKDYSVKDLAVEIVRVYYNILMGIQFDLYKSAKPNKEDIQQVVNNYAG